MTKTASEDAIGSLRNAQNVGAASKSPELDDHAEKIPSHVERHRGLPYHQNLHLSAKCCRAVLYSVVIVIREESGLELRLRMDRDVPHARFLDYQMILADESLAQSDPLEAAMLRGDCHRKANHKEKRHRLSVGGQKVEKLLDSCM